MPLSESRTEQKARLKRNILAVLRFREEIGHLMEGVDMYGRRRVEFLPASSGAPVSVWDYRKAKVTPNFSVSFGDLETLLRESDP